MCPNQTGKSFWTRFALQALVAALGLVAIVGSGGGGGAGDLLGGGDILAGIGTPPSVMASVEIVPGRQTVQAGATVVLQSRVAGISRPTYAWCRIPADSVQCSPLPGAVGATLIINGVSLADDNAIYQVTVSGSETSGIASSVLYVSSLPAVAYQDAEFLESDWSVRTLFSPSENGATHATSRQSAGGNPGAFVGATFDLSRNGSAVQSIFLSNDAVVAPATQGAVYRLDFTADCLRTSQTFVPLAFALIEQSGRLYKSFAGQGCSAGQWQNIVLGRSLGREDFLQFDGPACTAGQSCPDFSATAPPMRLGFVLLASLASAELSAGQTAHFAGGLDNWSVAVWRK